MPREGGQGTRHGPRKPLAQRYLEVFLDVLPVVGDPAGRDARLAHQLETDLPAQVVGDVPLLAREKQSGLVGRWLGPTSENGGGVGQRGAYGLREGHASSSSREHRPGHTHLPLLIHLREELVHVCQVLVLKEKTLRMRGRGGYRFPGSLPLPRGGPSSVAPLPSSPRPLFARLQAGVTQLKNNLPLWGYFYPGISPACPASTQTRVQPGAARPSENNRFSKQTSPLAGWDRR